VQRERRPPPGSRVTDTDMPRTPPASSLAHLAEVGTCDACLRSGRQRVNVGLALGSPCRAPTLGLALFAGLPHPQLTPPLEALLFGLAVVGAAFVLSWAAELAALEISAGLAISVLALVGGAARVRGRLRLCLARRQHRSTPSLPPERSRCSPHRCGAAGECLCGSVGRHGSARGAGPAAHRGMPAAAVGVGRVCRPLQRASSAPRLGAAAAARAGRASGHRAGWEGRAARSTRWADP
jgi:hypothetical protein